MSAMRSNLKEPPPGPLRAAAFACGFGQANLEQRTFLARRLEHRRRHRPAGNQPMQLGNRLLRQFPQLRRELHFPPPLARRVEDRPAQHCEFKHFLQAKRLRAKLRVIILKRPPLPLLILHRRQTPVGADVRRLRYHFRFLLSAFPSHASTTSHFPDSPSRSDHTGSARSTVTPLATSYPGKSACSCTMSPRTVCRSEERR